jgi:aspartate/methionine/tyrosine aminotransferase
MDDTLMQRSGATGQAVIEPTVRVQPFMVPETAVDQPAVKWDLTTPEALPVTPVVGQAVIDSLERGETGYTSGAGIQEVCEAVAAWSTAAGFPVEAGRVVVTNGASEARYILLRGLVTPGRRVLMTDQFDADTARIAEMVGGEVSISAGLPEPESGDLVLVAEASGFEGSRIDQEQIAAFLQAAAGAGATVVVDRSAVFDSYIAPEPFLRPELTGDIYTIGSMAGLLGLDAWRVGYLTSPEATFRRLAELKESMSISTSTPSQYAALSTLEHAGEILEAARQQATTRRDRATGLLDAAGIGYRMPDISPGLLIEAGMDDVRAADLLAAQGVRVEPGSVFSERLSGWLRIDLRAPVDVLEDGIRQMVAVLNEARK